jgi:hypothetical protein
MKDKNPCTLSKIVIDMLFECNKQNKQTYLAKISQGQRAQPPSKAQMTWPLLILIYRGHKAVMSLAAEIEFPDTFEPKVANTNAADAKKTAGRFVQWSMRVKGFQRACP